MALSLLRYYCVLKNKLYSLLKIYYFTNYFKVEAPITPNDDIRIFQQPPRITKVNQSLFDTINEIDRNTQYLGDNL